MQRFPNEASCITYLKEQREQSGIVCKHYGLYGTQLEYPKQALNIAITSNHYAQEQSFSKTNVDDNNCKRQILTELYRFLSTLKNLQEWRITPANNTTKTDDRDLSNLKPSYQELSNIFKFLQESIMPNVHFITIINHDIKSITPMKEEVKSFTVPHVLH